MKVRSSDCLLSTMLLLVVVLLLVSQHALGEVETTLFHTFEGMSSVKLPCFLPGGSWDIVSVVWSRIDIDSAVIQRYGQTNDHKDLNQYYRDRTSMNIDTIGIFYRDFALTLNKPRPSDSGIYTCTCHSTSFGVKVIRVELQVIGTWTLLFLLGSFALMALASLAALGVALYLWDNTMTVTQVEVREGVQFAKLNYRTWVQLGQDVTVEWSRCAPEPAKVHVYHSQRHRTIDQDELYRGRTNMRADCLTSRDLSLTLRDPCYRDSGTYICTVYSGQHVLVQKAVRLTVKVVQQVVNIWGSSKVFTLPFITTTQLPEDVSVEWWRHWPGGTVVHVFENGKDQPYRQDGCYHGKTMMNSDPLRAKDLSVTITVTEGVDNRGTYFCTVKREGYTLARKEVLVQVNSL